jgi:hypothetical protein
MPNSESQTEEVTNGAKTILKNTIGKTFKFLLKIIICIALVLILLVSFLKEIFKVDTSDQSAKANEFFNREKYKEYKIC